MEERTIPDLRPWARASGSVLSFERLVEENSRLKEKMQGIKMLSKADPALSLQSSSLSLQC